MKKYLPYAYHLFYWVGALMMVVGNFFIIRHLSVANIGLLVFGIGWVLQVLIDRKIPNRAYSPWIMFCFWALILILYIGILINNESYAVVRYVLAVPAIIFGYSAISALAPLKPISFYTTCFYGFVVTCAIIDLITFYNYYNLVFVHHAEGLHPTWINLIDMLYDKIIPFKFYHHTLGVLNVFWHFPYNFNANKKQFLFHSVEKYVQWLLALVLILFIHFLSARIALLCFYIIVMMLFFRYKDYFKGKYLLVAFLATIVIIFSLIWLFPTLQNKLSLTFNELLFYFNSDKQALMNGPNYRLRYQMEAIEFVKNNFWHGIGFEQKDALGINPHNMFLFYAICFGVPLTLVYIIITYLPLFLNKGKIALPIIGIYLIHTCYALTDNGLDILLYLYFFAFWAPFMFQYRKVWLQ